MWTGGKKRPSRGKLIHDEMWFLCFCRKLWLCALWRELLAKIWWEGTHKHFKKNWGPSRCFDSRSQGTVAEKPYVNLPEYCISKTSIHPYGTCLSRLSTCKKIICMTNQIKEGYCLKKNEILCIFFLFWDLHWGLLLSLKSHFNNFFTASWTFFSLLSSRLALASATCNLSKGLQTCQYWCPTFSIQSTFPALQYIVF